MRTAYCPKTHQELASVTVGTEFGHVPGHQYRDVDVVVSRRGEQFRVHVVEHWGSSQGYDEEHGRREIIGRGDSIREAVREAGERGRHAGMAGYMVEALSQAEDQAIDALADASALRAP